MPKCVQIRRKKQQPCIGDMDTLVTLQTRKLGAPVGGSAFYTLGFSGTEIWALIETKAGTELFDGVNENRPITHDLYVHFDDTITAEKWILLENGERLDILKVVNLDQRSIYMKLQCTDRGLDTHAGSEA